MAKKGFRPRGKAKPEGGKGGKTAVSVQAMVKEDTGGKKLRGSVLYDRKKD